MSQVDVNQVEALNDTVSFLAYVFTELPTKEFIAGLAKAGEAEGADALSMRVAESIRAYGDADSALLEISKDRARLLRALSKEGPTPPYESSYISVDMPTLYGDILAFCRKASIQMTPDYRERLDFLGTELSLLETLLDKLVAAHREGDAESAQKYAELAGEFFRRHMEPWMPKAASALEERAETGFYREMGTLLSSTVAFAADALGRDRR